MTGQRVLIVAESHWGNTDAVADEIAAGLREERPDVEVVRAEARDAPSVPEETALVVVGGPTHAFSMSRKNTREDAGSKGATQPHGPGIREWVDQVGPLPHVPVRTFDTRVPHFPGSAAGSAAKALRKHGWTDCRRGESFFVGGYEGPLADGELEHARRWGRELAELVH